MSSDPQTSLPSSTSLHTLSLDTIQPIQSPPPPEIEATLSRLSAYRNVRGVMILSRSPTSTASSSTITAQSNIANITEAESSSSSGLGGIIQTTGNVFQGDSGKKYARAIESIVGNVSKSLNDCEQGDELKFMRIRTKKHELIITPDEKYLLVVLQDPGQ